MARAAERKVTTGATRQRRASPHPRARSSNVGTLVAVDGLSAATVSRAAKRRALEDRGERAGISWWDASGIFGDVDAAGADIEKASVRTLMLLYAADLAFRLRWEIRPALAEGRRIIAAPYVDTAIALGRAAGLDDAWLRSLFNFAPPPGERQHVAGMPPARTSGHGFIEFASRHLAAMENRKRREELLMRTEARLKSAQPRKAADTLPQRPRNAAKAR